MPDPPVLQAADADTDLTAADIVNAPAAVADAPAPAYPDASSAVGVVAAAKKRNKGKKRKKFRPPRPLGWGRRTTYEDKLAGHAALKEHAKKMKEKFAATLDAIDAMENEKEELKIGLAAIGQNRTEEEIRKLMSIVDDNSGEIDMCEFVQFMQVLKKQGLAEIEARERVQMRKADAESRAIEAAVAECKKPRMASY
jgi:hypothetical protein